MKFQGKVITSDTLSYPA